MNIGQLWNEMDRRQDVMFYTTIGLPFTIRRNSNAYFDVYRNERKVRQISKDDMEFILNHPNLQWKAYSEKMQCASYALSIYEAIVGCII